MPKPSIQILPNFTTTDPMAWRDFIAWGVEEGLVPDLSDTSAEQLAKLLVNKGVHEFKATDAARLQSIIAT